MDLQHACAAVLDEVEGSLGCIVIDMQTGLTVAAEYRPGSVMDAGAINLVSVVSTNMFCGKLIRQFQLSLASNRSRAPGFVREVQMTTANTNQFMAAIPGWDNGIFVLVTDKSVSVGLGWMAVHRVIGELGGAPAAHDPAANNPQWGHDVPVEGHAPWGAPAAMPVHDALPSGHPAAAHLAAAQNEHQAVPPVLEPYAGSAAAQPAVASPAAARSAGAAAAEYPRQDNAQGAAAPNANTRTSARLAPASAQQRTREKPQAAAQAPLGPRANFMSRKQKR